MDIEKTFNLAVKNHKKHNFQVAIDYYNQILEIKKNHFDSLFSLGVLYLEIKNFELAIPLFEKVIQIDPNNVDANNNLGISFKELGEVKKAIKIYEKVIEINPNYINAQINLGIALADLGNYKKAISFYEKAIKIDSNSSDAHYNLGATYQNLGRYEEAISSYEKAIEINPNYTNTLNNLGILFKELGKFHEAIKCFGKIIKTDFNNALAIGNLSDILSAVHFISIPKSDLLEIKELLLVLFRKNAIDHTHMGGNIITALSISPNNNNIQKILDSENSILDSNTIQSLLKEELFLLMLKKTLIRDISLEKILTKLRSEILLSLNDTNKDILNNHFNFIVSLAEQCWFNEYIFFQSEKEIDSLKKLKNKVENNKEMNELEVAILGCYVPLNTSKVISEGLLVHKSNNILFNDLIAMHIKEPIKELELKKSIRCLSNISNSVSKKVRDQYEENPYPRYKSFYKPPQHNFIKWLNSEIKPNKIVDNGKFQKPDILIAGCGTGKHIASTQRYLNGNTLGVDLSLTSLAYAKRKINESGFKDVQFLQADILQLKELDKKFNVIESVGTLHHMRDPIKGLKVLTDILEPGGIMKLGFYSELAKQKVLKAREIIKQKNLKTTIEDIRIFRQEIINKKDNLFYKNLLSTIDFYSASGVRDLCFHVQEHRFKIPEISEMLKNLDLEFLGFMLVNPSIKTNYLKIFPEDKKNTSLGNWNQYEIKNPDIFSGMYQFWVRKK